MEAVFTYGTLTIPEVMQMVTGRVFASCEAAVPGFACWMIQNCLYPGITAKPGKSTEGRVYLDVDPHSLQLLDLFEDECYNRELVKITRSPGQATMDAFAYIIPPEDQHVLSNETWSPQCFIQTHLPSYLESCRNFHLHMSGHNPITPE